MSDNNNKKENLLKRISQAVSYTVRGNTPSSWFGAEQPLTPMAPVDEGSRQFDYPFAVNTYTQPKSFEGVTYSQLRGLAQHCDLLRLVIEKRKDQVSRLNFKFQLKNKKKDQHTDARCDELTEFFEKPDKINNWDDWLRALLEDVLVVDAATVYPRLTYGGQPYSFDLIDGTTIKRVLDDTGRTPMDGISVAYQQYLKGVPAWDFNCNELVFKPRNIRTDKIYGYSPVEQIITTVNIQMNKTLTQLSFYTNGNTPNLLLRVPPEWNADQIRKFQLYWDEINTGVNKNTAKFVPNGIDPYDTKPAEQKNEYDEWLARIICFAFSLSPQALSPQMNRATAQTAKESSDEEGLYPIMEWVRNFINTLISKYFGYNDIEFVWDIEEETDAAIQAEIDMKYVNAGIMTVNEVRKKLGLEPLSDEELASMKPQPFGAAKPKEEEEEPEGEEDISLPFNQKMSKAKKKTLSVSKPNILDLPEIVKEQEKLQATVKEYFDEQKKSILSQLNKALKKSAEGDIIKAKKKPTDNEEEPEDEDNSSLSYTDMEIDDIVDDLDFDLPKESSAAIIARVQASLGLIGALAAKYAVKATGTTDKAVIKETNAYVQAYAQDRSAALIGKSIVNGEVVDNPNAEYAITETTRDSIRSVIKQAVKNGDSNDVLATSIKEGYAFSDTRSLMIARTETNIADNDITFNMYKNSGVEKKSWLTAGDDLVSEECLANQADGVIDIDDNFSSGDSCPPCHPNCRCTLIAVFDKDE